MLSQPYRLPDLLRPVAQPRLFGLDEAGWLKALKLGEYAARSSARPSALQEVLFHYPA